MLASADLGISSSDDRGLALTGLIISAAGDAQPKYTLKDIAGAIDSGSFDNDLDALAIVSVLIQSSRDGVSDVLHYTGRTASSKEIAISVQENAERLSSLDEDGDGETAQPSVQLVRLTQLYTDAVPRLKTRKPASQTIQPTLDALIAAMAAVLASATIMEGRILVQSAASLVDAICLWVESVAPGNVVESALCHEILLAYLTAVLEACANLLGTSVAQRHFETRFRKLVIKSSVRDDWLEGEEVIRSAVRSAEALGSSFKSTTSKPSIASLLLLMHSSSAEEADVHVLESIFPAILASLQTNQALDETLGILLLVLYPGTPGRVPDLSPDLIIPLSTVLPPLCSVHPDPSTRHLAFKLLGRVLQLSPSALRLQILRDLLAPSEEMFPQMRIAAIGMAKDFVADALNSAPEEEMKPPDVFATPVLIQTIGPIVFQTDPPDLLQSTPTLSEFMDMPEAKRLVECLSLYYVLLLRDTNNKTGIRDPDTIKNVESSLLHPLRSAVQTWSNQGQTGGDLHALLPLASLEMSLARVDEALHSVAV